MKDLRLVEAMQCAKSGRAVVEMNFMAEVHSVFGEPINTINTSSLYSFLIKEAGRLCDAYASDLFIDLKTLDNQLTGEDAVMFKGEPFYWCIGIRDYGCDHEAYIVGNLEAGRADREYRAIYFLELTPDEKYEDYWNLTLYKVNASWLQNKYRSKVKYGV